jgi:pimeloyl-ACP methyl ester carboxylesterase
MNRMPSRASTLFATLGLVACGSSTTGTPPAGGELALCPAPVVVSSAEIPCSARSDERIAAMSDAGIGLTSALGLPPGRYALPENPEPSQLVVFFHGHQNDSCSWRDHLRGAAAQGAIAVAMNYTGQTDKDVPPWGFVENWGWFVRSGAADSIAAARYFLEQYPSITTVFNFGASMGGNVSGYAAYSAGAVRADCSPLWDWWIVTEGVHNLSEEYTGTRAVAQQSTDPDLQKAGAQAQQEIEEENDGTIEEVPQRYDEITNVLHAASLTALKGVVLTHGSNDSIVPFDQSQQMTQNLRASGIPAHFYLVTNSGHVWEGDGNAVVMKKGLEELYRLMAGGTVTNGDEPIAGP